MTPFSLLVSYIVFSVPSRPDLAVPPSIVPLVVPSHPTPSHPTPSHLTLLNTDLRKAEAESVAAVAALDETVRARLEELVRPDELDSFEVRALGKFDVVDAMDILDR